MPARVRVTLTKRVKMILEVAADTYDECHAEAWQAVAKDREAGWDVQMDIIATSAPATWVFWARHFADDITQPGILCIHAPLACSFTEATRQTIVEYATAAGWLAEAWNGLDGCEHMSIQTSRALPQADRDAWSAFLSTVKFQTKEERELQKREKARQRPCAAQPAECGTCGYAPCACDQQ